MVWDPGLRIQSRQIHFEMPDRSMFVYYVFVRVHFVISFIQIYCRCCFCFCSFGLCFFPGVLFAVRLGCFEFCVSFFIGNL